MSERNKMSDSDSDLDWESITLDDESLPKKVKILVIPGDYGFVAQLNEGCHMKKKPQLNSTILQPYDGNKFNFTGNRY